MSRNSVSFGGLLKAQRLQLTKQTGPVIGLIGSGVLLMAIALIAAYTMVQAISSGTMEVTDQQVREIPSLGFAFTQLLLGSAFILLVTTEWSSGAIVTSIATTQRRSGIFWSKAAVTALFAVLTMAIAGLACAVFANFIVAGEGRTIDLGEWLVQRELIALVAAGLFSSLLALGIAFLLRKTALALVVYIAITIVAPVAFGMFPSDFMQQISIHLPLNASGYMMTTGATPEGGLDVVAGYVTMAVWAAASLLAGWWRMVRID